MTIFGQSAGGMSVSLHLVSPLSKGLFHRAIVQSGPSSTPLFCGKVTKPLQLEAFAKAINCSLGNNVVECARGKTVEEILKGQMAITMGSYKRPLDIVGPIVDGEFLPDKKIFLEQAILMTSMSSSASPQMKERCYH